MGYIVLVIAVAVLADIIVILILLKTAKPYDEEISEASTTGQAANDASANKKAASVNPKIFIEYDYSAN